MDMKNIHSFEELENRARNQSQIPSAVVAAADEAHTLEAIVKATQDHIIRPILVGDGSKIRQILTELGEDPQGYSVEDRASVEDIMAKAVELIHAGEASILVKGKLQTRDLMKAVVSRENGLRTGSLISLVALFQVPAYHKLLLISDVGINTTPDLQGKKDILVNSVRFMHALGNENPKVAVLSSGEQVNPKVPSTSDADALKQMNRSGEITGCIVEGPISLDLAVSKESARVKGYESPVAGDADILIVPDIVSGNLLAKSITEFAGGRTAGLVMGAKVPIVLTSRSATVQDKYDALAMAAFAE